MDVENRQATTVKINKKLIIYQLLPRLFGNKQQDNIPYGTILQNGCGKFEDIDEKALGGIMELGATHIWFTGIISHSTLTAYNDKGLAANNANIVKGRAGSAYAIRDYYDVDPDLAVNVENRMEEFVALVSRTHQMGMKVIIDLVPNHVAREYHSICKPAGVRDFGADDDVSKGFSATNDYYYIPDKEFVVPETKDQESSLYNLRQTPYIEFPAKVSGNNVFSESPSPFDWYETVKLNYGVDFLDQEKTYFDPVPAVWSKMRDILIYWMNKGIDGFRCDMVEMVPLAFWNWVIAEIKTIKPEVIFIGEAYDPEKYQAFLNSGKFDYLYDKVGLYDGLKKLVRSEDDADVQIIRQASPASGLVPEISMLRFLENHDEERIASPGFAGQAELALPAMVATATLSGGPLMIYFGQEVGEPAAGSEGFSTADNRTTIFDYWGVPEHQKWMNGGRFDGALLSTEQQLLRNYYKSLLRFSVSADAIANGAYWEMPASGNMNIKMFGYIRYTAAQRVLVLLNFDRHYRMESQIQIPDFILQNKPVNQVLDILSGMKIADVQDNTIPIWVLPTQAQILVF